MLILPIDQVNSILEFQAPRFSFVFRGRGWDLEEIVQNVAVPT